MARIESYVSRDFLFEFEQHYLRLKTSFEIDDEDLLDKFRNIERLLITEELSTDISKQDLKAILYDNNNPLLKRLFKAKGHPKLDTELFDRFGEMSGEEYFKNRKEQFPFQLFALSNTYNAKKLKKYQDYYGYHFINVDALSDFTFNDHFQSGVAQLDKEKVYSAFRPFSSLVLIDPYFLAKAANKDQLIDLLYNILPRRTKQRLFIDIVTVENTSDQELFKIIETSFRQDLDKLKEELNIAEIELQVQTFPASLMHDRNYIGNGFIVNMGYGLSSLEDKKDSDIRVTSILSAPVVQGIVDKLSVYKNYRRPVGNNPIWSILD